MPVINLSSPIRSEKVQGGTFRNGGWRTVFVYLCGTCKKEVRVYANAFRGKTPVPGTGGIRCPHCEANEIQEVRSARGVTDPILN